MILETMVSNYTLYLKLSWYMVYGITNNLKLKCHKLFYLLYNFDTWFSFTCKRLSSKEFIMKILGIEIYKKSNEKIYIFNIFNGHEHCLIDLDKRIEIYASISLPFYQNNN